jgi:hypothetical protein
MRYSRTRQRQLANAVISDDRVTPVRIAAANRLCATAISAGPMIRVTADAAARVRDERCPLCRRFNRDALRQLRCPPSHWG